MKKVEEVTKRIEDEMLETKKSLFSKVVAAPAEAALKIIHGGKK